MDHKLGQDGEALPESDTALQFTAFDINKKNYPRSLVAALPTPPARLGRKLLQEYSSVFDKPDRLMFERGRYALHQAMCLAGVVPGETILLPAYHCRTMLDPALSIGARILLYPLTARLAPDFEALASMIEAHQPKAMLLPHYFGFPQNLEAASAFCKQHRIRLIEDCAHAFFGRQNEVRLGEVGDYAVASVPKFFAHGEGGILIGDGVELARSRSKGRNATTPELMATVKSIARYAKHSVEQTLSTNRKEIAQTSAESVERASEKCDDIDIVYETRGASTAYDESKASTRDSFLVTQIVRLTDRRHLVEARRKRYRQWLTVVADIPSCEPLFRELPDDVVPYMFPLRVHDPQPVFDTLKCARLPIFRWDELATSTCAFSTQYRLGLFQLPCHQSLSDVEMEWMADTVHQALASRRL